LHRLCELGITHVIDVRMYPSKKLQKFRTIHLNFKDNARPRPMWFYARALGFYRKALDQLNSKVYMMCRAGRRRSASMTYFLLRASGASPAVAEAVILQARRCAKIVTAYRESGEKYLRRGRESDCPTMSIKGDASENEPKFRGAKLGFAVVDAVGTSL
jgi:hypothetical protein